MATDFETLTAMLDKAKIGWQQASEAPGHGTPTGSFSIDIGNPHYAGPTSGPELTQPYDGGYNGFWTEIAFSPRGELLAMWAWE